MTAVPVVNALTIDVEDYFQVSAFAPYIARSDWELRESRVEANVARLLSMLEGRRVKATFFTLGWIAERHPDIVRSIVSAGHELASHGYGHQRVSDLDRPAFRYDVERSKDLLEDISGVAVHGYRAPSFSIGPRSPWAFDVLAEAGYRYSSSVYPIAHDHYGAPSAPRFAYRVHSGMLEVPPTTLRVAGRNLPSSGGGYFRLLPYSMSRWMLRQVNERELRACVFYFHPWEIDVHQPRIAGLDLKTRVRHYLNIPKMEDRLERLLSDFSWGRMDAIFLGTVVH